MQSAPATERPTVLQSLAALLWGKPAIPLAAPPQQAPRRVSGEQKLGPNQLKWLEARFQYYGIHRKQAEAPTGVAAITPPDALPAQKLPGEAA